mgnify:CR=1 FL=1
MRIFGSSMVNWRGRVFSDELFDGKEYTLQVKEQLRSDTKYYTKRHIRLYSLSESLLPISAIFTKTSRMKVSWADLRM